MASEVFYTPVFSKNLRAFNSGVRKIVNKGGTSSSKTISILQLLLEIALNRRETGVVISVISETLPHLKLGAIRDFEWILRQKGLNEGTHYSQAYFAYTFGKSIVEFFSADSGKATGPRRDIAYLNECNHIPYSVVSEIEQRTRETIFFDYNPSEVFWIEDKVLALPATEYTLIKSNYKDNTQLEPSIIREIELKAARDPNYKRIHIDVEYGVYEGLIFPNFNQVDELPATDKQRYGMDFGFTNDPTTLIDVRKQDGQWWADELLYRTGMTNQDIVNEIKPIVGRKLVIADSSEPKSIHEISIGGINIIGADKGKDSVRSGIDHLKSMPINVTKRSVHLIKELRNYRYRQDKSGTFLNEPVDAFNHLIDPWRYAASDLKGEFAVGGYRVRNISAM